MRFPRAAPFKFLDVDHHNNYFWTIQVLVVIFRFRKVDLTLINFKSNKVQKSQVNWEFPQGYHLARVHSRFEQRNRKFPLGIPQGTPVALVHLSSFEQWNRMFFLWDFWT